MADTGLDTDDEPVSIDSSSDSAQAALSGPLMETVEDEAAPMEESSPIMAVTDAILPVKKPAYVVSGSYEWHLHNVSKVEKEYSDKFEIDGIPWRILVFPHGNGKQAIAIYVECADLDLREFGYSVYADVEITLVNQMDTTKSVKKDTNNTFTKSSADWGFAEFYALDTLQSEGFLMDDSLRIGVTLHVDLHRSSCYDSKRETGYVGLKNQGATCYLNSWLQTLFNINCFRQAVFHIPTTEEDEPASSIPLALQTLFYKLQFGNGAVSTKDLTKSFGWDTYGGLMQEDVHEFNKILCDALENKMKGTKVEGMLNKLFEGHIVKTIECVNVDYKSTKRDEYMDIFLDVKGCKNVYESFDRLTAEERLDGDNKYNAEGHGLQDATIGDKFEDFPPVLQLHLKRFEYDFERESRVKINDRYEFPEELDLDIGNRKYLSEGSDAGKHNKYKLHSVLVHSGSTHGGHYFAFTRPDGSTWLRFDDEKVTKEEAEQAVQEQFGEEAGAAAPLPGLNPLPRLSKFSSAYMLLYVREEEWPTVMCPVPEEDVALHLRQRLKAEAEEKERLRKEKAEAHQYTTIRVATSDDLKAQIGSTTFVDLVDLSQVKSFKVKRETLMSDFRQQLATEMGVPVERQRLWHITRRHNKTVRPSRPLAPDEFDKQVQDVREGNVPPKPGAPSILRLWLQDVPNAHEAVDPLQHVMLFIKRYDPRAAKLSYVNCALWPRSQSLGPLHAKLAEKFGIASERLQIKEEVNYSPELWLQTLSLSKPIAQLELEHGDILIAQEVIPKEEGDDVALPDLNAYMTDIHMRREVTFKQLANHAKEEGLKVVLRGDMSYTQVAAALAQQLQLPGPDFLRLTMYNNYTRGPRTHPVTRSLVQQLENMLVRTTGDGAPILYYEVLDMPLEQFEKMKTLQISLCNARGEEVGQHKVRMEGDATVAQLLQRLRSEVAWQPTSPLRLVEVQDSRIYKVYEDSDKLSSLKDDNYWQLMAAETPLDAGEGDEEVDVEGNGDMAADSMQHELQPLLLRVCHVPPDSATKLGQQRHAFGTPLLIHITPSTRLADIKPRIQARLGITDEQFSTWSFLFFRLFGGPDQLEDENVLFSRLTRRSGDGFTNSNDYDLYLGLEHAETGPKRQKRRAPRDLFFERPMRIG